MSFELTNTSIIFQISINKILKKLMNVICIIYSNDILNFNKNLANHQRHMQQAFDCLKNFELCVNLKKCEFVIEKIEFLSFIVFTKRVQMNSKQIQMIKT